MAKKTKSRLKQLQLEFEQLERERKKRSRGKSVIFHTGRAGEILKEIEQIREERREKASANREYGYLKKAIESMQKQGRTMMELPEERPKDSNEKKRISNMMKEELRAIAAETREEAKHASSDRERKRLDIKAKLDETWGPEREKLKRKLEEIHKQKRANKGTGSAVEDLYLDFWSNEDASVMMEEEPEPEPEEDFGFYREMDDDEFPF